VTEREVEPYQLFYADGVRYLKHTVVCEKDETSPIAWKIKPHAYFVKAHGQVTQPINVIKIRFAPNAVRWVREQQHYGYQLDEKEISQGTVMVYHVNDESEIIPWILGWGTSAEVLAPQKLRKSLRETALELANLLTGLSHSSVQCGI
jgi:predicted DNA-binding transcriptional regulator YafY